jgi:predicted dehydrogenase
MEENQNLPDLKFAVIGTGFWARYQLAAWREVRGADCVALYNRTKSKAQSLATEFGISAVYDDAEELFKNEQIDFIDIITDVETHQQFVELGAKYGVAIICQKPMAPTLQQARQMVETCAQRGVPFYIHENWRWQTPLRQLKKAITSRRIGDPFRARLDFVTSFPVFDNQPFLRDLEQFIITDIGSHILDTARFLFGDAQTLFASTRQIHKNIKGEDVATVVMEMNGVTVTCNMSYASRTAAERFPQTFAFVEGKDGSVELTTDYWLHITNEYGTLSRRHAPPRYAWADPQYDVVHASIVDCHRNLLHGLQTNSLPETHAGDNLKTVELVFAAYESARRGAVINIEEWKQS